MYRFLKIKIEDLEALKVMNDTQAASLFRAIRAYHIGEEFELDAITKLAFLPFERQFEKQSKTSKLMARVNKENGDKGGRPKVIM